MTRLALIAGLLMATTATAENIDGIQNHDVQKRFLQEPCSAVIGAIDTPAPGAIGVGEMAMTFGFLMGFEALHPGIRGDHETILMRLRTDCANQPEKTAMALLMGYAGK